MESEADLSSNWVGNTEFLLPFLLFLMENTIPDYYPWFSEKFDLSVEDQRGCLLGFCELPI